MEVVDDGGGSGTSCDLMAFEEGECEIRLYVRATKRIDTSPKK